MTRRPSSDVQAVIDTFEEVFDLASPSPFGTPTNGVSDGANGVQWNAFWKDNSAFLGVNLEGMEYKEWEGGQWPIGTLIRRELEVPTLVQRIVSNAARDEIELSWRRDAWQVRSRAPIEERNIAPTPILLGALTEEGWLSALREAGRCLGSNYQGRALLNVTRLGSRVTGTMEVSPHLQFRMKIWDGSPLVSNRITYMRKGEELLRPLYEWTTERCG